MNYNFDTERPIYIQIMDVIKNNIIRGEYLPGSKLPSVRELSSLFKVNPNTIVKSLYFLENECIDLICTHPPYANSIKYSEGIKGDISLLNVDIFLIEMQKVAMESYRVLKKGKQCDIMIGDIRRNGKVVKLGFFVMECFLQAGFVNQEIIIKEQHNCRATGFWKTNSVKYNFLLLAHEYLFVFKK